MTTAAEFHRLTTHQPEVHRRQDPRYVQFRSMDPATRPPPSKTYPPELERVDLSEDVEVDRLSRVLFGSAGVVRVGKRGPWEMQFRAAGSAGNLQPLEIYVLHDGGLFHYDAQGHALVRLRSVPESTPPALIVTGVPWRTGWKYRERGWRHLYWDAGSMLAQTLELEPAAAIEMGFVDRDVAALVGADGVHEFPLAIVALEGVSRLPDPDSVPAGVIADSPLEFPLVTQSQHAGDLTTPAEVERWRVQSIHDAPPEWPWPGKLMEVIRRRGSSRKFDSARAATPAAYRDAMAWATRPVRGDFEPAVEHYAIVHAVEETAPGAYKWPDTEPIHTGDRREEARYLCLGQDLGGDGCYTVFHCADVDLLDSRRYRAALLEAGVVSGRLHLASFALGFGATGLTYYDELVRQFFCTDAWPLLVTAVGAPAYRNRRGGLPRRPTVLHW